MKKCQIEITLILKSDFCNHQSHGKPFNSTERSRSHKMQYDDPINMNYEATTAMYYDCIAHCIAEIQKQEASERKNVSILF